jgi:hypothetical protein
MQKIIPITEHFEHFWRVERERLRGLHRQRARVWKQFCEAGSVQPRGGIDSMLFELNTLEPCTSDFERPLLIPFSA